ncbi:MAG TPA: site-2 protease family protein [Gemmatimonadaceae bacterium]
MSSLQNVLFVAPVLLFSVIAHEYAHGYAALRQGDNTALMLGRLTWNPLKHIDPFLTIIMPVVLYYTTGIALGGAKPVPVNPRNYRNFRRGDIIVSLAGVAANLVIALLCTVLIAVFGLLARTASALGPTVGILQVMMIWGVTINLGLIAFNLIPIPPLDGSHVMKHLLPPAWSLRYQEISRYGFIILILLLSFGGRLLDLWMRPAMILRMGLLTSVGSFIHPSAEQWFQ